MIAFPVEAARVVPHANRMLLLDTVTAGDENSLTATAVVRASSPLNHDGAAGSWTGIEFMAQAIAALEGCRALEQGESPKVGFLIGARQYACNVSSFATGVQLNVHVTRQHEHNGLGLFDARITGTDHAGNDITANAVISVFQPVNADEFLQEART